ncbi:MAG: hypothetical protein CO001_02125 [Candidatus Portnoybacteria bacterium CG_4_8_14_3_um_filter_40_10]|uniref:Uncharacterized protein n=3 Tax=Candidatus Portnoyibacteriota TaxID=1817913 RepID=A0A2M7IID7_9BACT|nr:MAG: hypothetical protein CO001_02125 [Candidatus Portnoybacteria bacterium CG_4_8_14_3_um_filter_40_10]
MEQKRSVWLLKISMKKEELAMEKTMVNGLDQTPDAAEWFEKYKGITKQIDEQLLRGLKESGKGLTLGQLQLVVEHRNPFDVPVLRIFTDRLIVKTGKLLSRCFHKPIVVELLPSWFTEDNLKKAAKFNLKPIFLPGEELSRDLKNWMMPPAHFYEWIMRKKIAKDSAILKRGWYLADFSIGVDYADGMQVFPNDPLAPIIERLRQGRKVGKYGQTPMGSRFAIKPQSEWPLVIAELVDNELKIQPYKEKRLERYIEFLAIGNVYDKNRGKFNMWEWFADDFEGSGRLCGGGRGGGGLAGIRSDWADGRNVHIVGRPLVSF